MAMDLVDIDKVLDILEQSVAEDANRTIALQQQQQTQAQAAKQRNEYAAFVKSDERRNSHDDVDSARNSTANAHECAAQKQIPHSNDKDTADQQEYKDNGVSAIEPVEQQVSDGSDDDEGVDTDSSQEQDRARHVEAAGDELIANNVGVNAIETEVVQHIAEKLSAVAIAPASSHLDNGSEGASEPSQLDDSCAHSNHVRENKFENESDGPKIDRPLSFGYGMEDISDTELNAMLEEMENSEEFQSALHGGAVEAQQSVVAVPDAAEPHRSQLSETGSVQTDDTPSTTPADSLPCSSSSSSSSGSSCSAETSLECENAAGASNGGECNAVEQNEADAVECATIPTATAVERPQRPTTLDLKNVKSQQQDLDADAENNHGNLTATFNNDRVALNNLRASNTPVASNVDVNEVHTMNAGEPLEDSSSGAATTIAAIAPIPVVNAVEEQGATALTLCRDNIGKVPPVWVPDYMAAACMQCPTRFTMIKRRHHCRACGQLLCSACCSQKFKLNFITTGLEVRVCVQCYLLLTQNQAKAEAESNSSGALMPVGTEAAAADTDITTPNEAPQSVASATARTVLRSPNPNNPMEYCSTIPPHKQVDTTPIQPPTVIVPIGVLKKDGSQSSSNSSAQMRKRKNVMFSDGIAPGSELASIEQEWNEPQDGRGRGSKARNHQSAPMAEPKPPTPAKDLTINARELSAMGLVAQLFRSSVGATAGALTTAATAGVSVGAPTASDGVAAASNTNDGNHKGETITPARAKRLPPNGCDEHGCFIPKDSDSGTTLLPPLFERKEENTCDYIYKEVTNNNDLIERMRHETLRFAITSNFHVFVKVVHLKCCMNRTVINFTTHGMHHVGNDEVIILLEFKPEVDNESPIPVDIFQHLYDVYRDAEMGRPIAELSYTSPRQSCFLGSREYGGFIYIRTTFQCLQEVIVPESPYLIGVLIHRYEVPWAKIFPLRLMLRLGAQYRYYPCPHISIRHRESVYAEIAQTIINFLADFRNYTYTLPFIRGMLIHMEKRQTTVLIPRNRQEDVIKAINNSSDHILAFGGNFSKLADGHLVCIQNVNDDRSELYAYSTQAINLQGHTRKVTGANFLVLNEALKSTSGLSGKCSLVEDGLMVQILPAKMEEVRNALRNQQDIDIVCGPLNAEEQQTEIVKFKWIANDRDFNVGVKSPIDGQSLEGVYNIRVHASFNYSNTNFSIRLTDIYIIKFEDWYNAGVKSFSNVNTTVNITRLAEQVGRSVSMALVPFLDLLIASGNCKLGLRATLQQDNVSYEAGSRGTKLPPLYMNSLDNHLIPTLHNESNDIEGEPIVMELIFYILNV